MADVTLPTLKGPPSGTSGDSGHDGKCSQAWVCLRLPAWGFKSRLRLQACGPYGAFYVCSFCFFLFPPAEQKHAHVWECEWCVLWWTGDQPSGCWSKLQHLYVSVWNIEALLTSSWSQIPETAKLKKERKENLCPSNKTQRWCQSIFMISRVDDPENTCYCSSEVHYWKLIIKYNYRSNKSLVSKSWSDFARRKVCFSGLPTTAAISNTSATS